MPQCTLVLVAGRREEQDRGVAAAIQREPSSHCPGVADSPGICPSGGPTGRRMKTGSSAFGRTKNRGTVSSAKRQDQHHCDGREIADFGFHAAVLPFFLSAAPRPNN